MANICELCERRDCHGECENYILEMALDGADVSEFDKLFRRIPKFNYALTSKVSSIFGTNIEVVNNDSNTDENLTNQFEQVLYKTNENGNTNLSEVKRAIRQREIFGISYIFFDDVENNLYFLREDEVKQHNQVMKDAVIHKTMFYTIGDPELTVDQQIEWGQSGYIKQQNEDTGENIGYIVHPDNMIKLYSDVYVLNTDLDQLQLLLAINTKFIDSTKLRDFGDMYALTDEPKEQLKSAVADDPIRNGVQKGIQKMNDKVAEMIKRNKTDDTGAIVLDNRFRDIKQFEPITKITDYQFVWEHIDDIISSVINWPKILMGLGQDAGNVGKEALIKDARANYLTPVKNDIANSLSVISRSMFGDEYYIRFKDYEDTEI